MNIIINGTSKSDPQDLSSLEAEMGKLNSKLGTVNLEKERLVQNLQSLDQKKQKLLPNAFINLITAEKKRKVDFIKDNPDFKIPQIDDAKETRVAYTEE